MMLSCEEYDSDEVAEDRIYFNQSKKHVAVLKKHDLVSCGPGERSFRKAS